MKKLAIATAVFVLGYCLHVSAVGPMRGTPRGDPQALATADYGGVYVATMAFGPLSGTGVAVTTACSPCHGVFYGVMFSSGSGGAYDFVDIFDSTGTDTATKAGTTMRVYNVQGSTSTNQSATSGFSGPPKPVHFSKGLLFKPNVGTYNMIDGLYYQEPDANIK